MVSHVLDLSALSNGSLGTPINVDFVTPDIRHNKIDISISPAIKRVNNPDGIFYGLEIMKMSNLQHPLDEGIDLPSIKKSSLNEVTVIASLISFVTTRDNTIITNVSNTGLRVPFTIVQMATNNFVESLAIGTGGFGKVYRGFLADGTKVAVKRGHTQSQQGQTLFQTEIEMLSQFLNRHLVSLIGYCNENSENTLIYEYMENGTLKSHPCGSGYPCMSWKQRFYICIGAAIGINFLHTASPTLAIHRDVKSSNILLDENFKAKVADFGSSKPRVDDKDSVTTYLKGSFGYIDLEYIRTQKITNRPFNDHELSEDTINLTQWALEWQKKGQLMNIIDPSLQGNINPESLRYALKLQEAPEEQSVNVVHDISEQATTSAHYGTTSEEDLPSGSMSKVFSEILTCE
ncbi:Receptor-like protein kinase HERK 1 [Bienertia sinuspersici]